MSEAVNQDSMNALVRFLSSRDNREAELLAASNRNLQRARDADGRAARMAGEMGKIRTYAAAAGDAEFSENEALQAINETANDALAEHFCGDTAVRMAGDILVNACHGASMEAGWWSNLKTGESLIGAPRIVSEKLMLIVSEVAEAMEGHRKNLMDDKLPHRTMLEVELADAVIRIADLAGALGLDLGAAIAEKMAFNAVRPDHKPEARLAAGGKTF